MPAKLKRLAVLGSTGSVGQQTLEIVRVFPEQFQVMALAAGQNYALLKRQTQEFNPRFVYCEDRKAFHGTDFISCEEMVQLPDIDMIVGAISGSAGLKPVLAAVQAGKTIALANKESLVMAGEIIMAEVRRTGAQILPVDSEHSAVWQCLRGETQTPTQIILTASGGPFRGYTPQQLEKVTVEQALNHPSWKMGKKVTVDSATLMNKGLEVIEAHWLFNIPYDRIRVLVHPQSVIHSMVEFPDGSVKAQLGFPDMRLPIQHALSYPDRLPNAGLPKMNWDSLRALTFEQPDLVTFTCLRLAVEAGKKGGTYPAVLSSADEVAVNAFLAGCISFGDIAHVVEQTLTEHKSMTHPSIEDVLAADDWAKKRATQLVTGANKC